MIRERFGIDLRDIAGARMSGEIPVGNAFVNRMIAERLGAQSPVTAVRVEAREGDQLVAEVVPRARLMPTLRIAARIEQQPDFPNDPRLVLRWSMPGAGPLALFAAPALAFFKALPPGFRADGDRIIVDVAALLASHGLREAVDHIRALKIHTQPGGFVLRFELGVSAPGSAARPM